MKKTLLVAAFLVAFGSACVAADDKPSLHGLCSNMSSLGEAAMSARQNGVAYRQVVDALEKLNVSDEMKGRPLAVYPQDAKRPIERLVRRKETT